MLGIEYLGLSNLKLKIIHTPFRGVSPLINRKEVKLANEISFAKLEKNSLIDLKKFKIKITDIKGESINFSLIDYTMVTSKSINFKKNGIYCLKLNETISFYLNIFDASEEWIITLIK